VGFDAVNERKDHFFATQPTSHCVEQIEEPEDHHSIIIEVNRGVEVVGIGHTSWVLAQRPSMGVMLNP
jgi:gluconate kinase